MIGGTDMTVPFVEFDPVDYRQMVGVRVRTHRSVKGIGQEELAKLVGCTAGYISCIERGTSNITLDILVAIALALQTEPYKLLQRIEL